MTRRTEAFEQEHIDAFIEAERVPNHPEYSLRDAEGEALEPGQLGRIVLERTDVARLEFDSMGTYIDGSW